MKLQAGQFFFFLSFFLSFLQFQSGHFETKDEKRRGCSQTLTNDANVAIFAKLIRKQAQTTVKKKLVYLF